MEIVLEEKALVTEPFHGHSWDTANPGKISNIAKSLPPIHKPF
jgi:hypothetical protein